MSVGRYGPSLPMCVRAGNEAEPLAQETINEELTGGHISFQLRKDFLAIRGFQCFTGSG